MLALQGLQRRINILNPGAEVVVRHPVKFGRQVPVKVIDQGLKGA
jgi:hypothetical protein